ncbi:metal dependent phosphohydrolase [Thermosyntropha lipolytica DSM 11003]|uniref:bis(5'-nucleosyl)-tetraphosphatase (symmetrical) n=1 Tax=Thermosyntropha lipolytica DSM 11003 TaxID=1123382 RepID=A0A1M5R3L9_9FIRM|nr:bis(5'-nucleosyl)-tetraphosphatase (symmetrical) YqeK [Thermosyntropha lipolytica]SHH20706.1 metal dependent phosphohydrolase [Thermosyntropha lipolytica DSM 11003]
MYDIDKITEIVALRLSPGRFKHSLEVAREARRLAEKLGLDEEKAYLAGIVHDYAKGIAGDKLILLAEEFALLDDPIYREVPDLLHAPVGAFLVQKELKIEDPEILNAVARHTLGDIKMSTLDKVIFLADMIEPGRDFPGIERLRCLTERNLDQAMLYALESTICYCMEKGRIIHPRTVIVRNIFLQKLK